MKTQLPAKYFQLLFLVLMVAINLSAQDNAADSVLNERLSAIEKDIHYNKPGQEHFLITGLATVGFSAQKINNTVDGFTTREKTNSLGDVDHFEFSPMLLWRHGQKLLMEFEPSFSDNGLGVNWADISYFAAPGLILRAGYLVLPFGTYSKRLAAGWIDKLATDPMGIADMTPTDYGIEMEGGLPLGKMKMNYDIALSNGSQLMNDGTISSGDITDNNTNKTLTARLGWLPFSNSTLELGISGMFGKLGDAGTPFANASGKMYAADLNYVNTFQPVLVNIKSQFNFQDITGEPYPDPRDPSQTYSFKNHTSSSFIQCALRPTGAGKLIRNFELAGRYTHFDTPANSLFGSRQSSVAAGLNYWLSWRSVVKLTYEAYKGKSTASKFLDAYTGLTKTSALYLQFAIQL
ncbi:MAG: hypothetical protein GC171_11825 [Terrimonas sp.]|nr:hypothetical protein [Terrimonas sp.]